MTSNKVLRARGTRKERLARGAAMRAAAEAAERGEPVDPNVKVVKPNTRGSKYPPVPKPLMDMVSKFLVAQGMPKASHILRIETQKREAIGGLTFPVSWKDAAKKHPSLVEMFDEWEEDRALDKEYFPEVKKKADAEEAEAEDSDAASDSSSGESRKSASSASETERATFKPSITRGKEGLSNSASKPQAHTAPSQSASSAQSNSSSSSRLSSSQSASPSSQSSGSPLSRKSSGSNSASDSEGSPSDQSSVKGVKVTSMKTRPASKPKAAPYLPSNKSASPRIPSAKSSASGTSSESSSISDSSSSSAEEPAAKRAKRTKKATSSSSSSDSSSGSDTGSGSDSEDEEPKRLKDIKIPPPIFDTPRQDSSASSATLAATSPAHGATSSLTSKRKRGDPAEEREQLSFDAIVDTDTPMLGRTAKTPFSRIGPTTRVDPRFASNKYIPYDYAEQAHRDLSITKGRGFTKEKNKKKRGSYKGGRIDIGGGKGIKFED